MVVRKVFITFLGRLLSFLCICLFIRALESTLQDGGFVVTQSVTYVLQQLGRHVMTTAAEHLHRLAWHALLKVVRLTFAELFRRGQRRHLQG